MIKTCWTSKRWYGTFNLATTNQTFKWPFFSLIFLCLYITFIGLLSCGGGGLVWIRSFVKSVLTWCVPPHGRCVWQPCCARLCISTVSCVKLATPKVTLHGNEAPFPSKLPTTTFTSKTSEWFLYLSVCVLKGRETAKLAKTCECDCMWCRLINHTSSLSNRWIQHFRFHPTC